MKEWRRLQALTIRRHGRGEPYPMSLLLLADPSQAAVESYIDRGKCFVAELNDAVVGVYVLLDTRPKTVELVNIAVAEQAQGKGVGRRLVGHAVTSAKTGGYTTMEVGTGNSSIGQLAFYQKCGFRIVGVDRGFFELHYPEPIYENGIHCRDMVRLALHL
jgi:ribosomal protein S18 acetylase RimI-like enzyme